jgi:hypothetical protein
MSITILDPRLPPEEAPLVMARRLASLAGATLGLLDNAKIGTARFYDYVEAEFRARHGVARVVRRRKPDTSRPAPPEVLAALAAADAVVSGVGD